METDDRARPDDRSTRIVRLYGGLASATIYLAGAAFFAVFLLQTLREQAPRADLDEQRLVLNEQRLLLDEQERLLSKREARLNTEIRRAQSEVEEARTALRRLEPGQAALECQERLNAISGILNVLNSERTELQQ